MRDPVHAMAPADILLPALLFGSAALYTSVGHAGASAYLASMALVGLAPETMRPTALVLNICVASFSAIRFWRAGLVDARLAAWLLAGAAPLAFLGGAIKLPGEIYRPLVGVLLIVAAIRLLLPLEVATNRDPKPPHPVLAALTGATIGLLSGLPGNLASVQRLPSELPIYLAAAMAGALVGTALGVKRLPSGMILKALGAVLVIAGLKLIFT